MPEFHNDIHINMSISGEEELEKARGHIHALEDEIDRAKSTIQSLEDELNESASEMERFARGNGLDIMREELSRYKETASQAVHEFRAFLESVNLNDAVGTNDGMFTDLFRQIREGSLTAGQAIMHVKTEMTALFEEAYSKSGNAFDTQAVQQFTATLNKVVSATDQIISRLNTIESGGGIGFSEATGETANFATVLDRVEESARGMSEEVRASYDAITGLVRSLSEYASLDDTKLLGVSQAFRNIADIGRGSYGTKSVENIVHLAKELQGIGSSNSLRFDFTGFNNLKVSKSSISNLAEFLPKIARVKTENLEKLAKIDLTNFNNLKIGKGSAENIKNLTQAMQTLYDITKQISAAVETEEKKSRKTSVKDTSVYSIYSRITNLMNSNKKLEGTSEFRELEGQASILSEAIKYAKKETVSLEEAFEAVGYNGSEEMEKTRLVVEKFKAAISDAGGKTKTQLISPGTKEYATDLQQINTLLDTATSAQKKFTAAKVGEAQGSYSALGDYIRELNTLKLQLEQTKLSQEEYNTKSTELSQKIGGAIMSIQSMGKNTLSLGDKFKNALQKFSTWFSASQVFLQAIRLLKQMVTNVKDVDAAMTELKKVTNETDATYEKFLTNASVRAKKLGATLSDVVSASADFARLGYDLEAAEKISDAALVYKNVGDGIENINDSSESIISTLQAFSDEIVPEDAMLIVDKFNEVGNHFAITSKGIGDALLKSAAAMHAAGNSLDETIALATAANTVVQNPETVGTALKTVSMYLRAAKTEAEEAGESTDGMASSVSELRSELLALTGNKVDIQIDENTFKDTYQILEELSKVWNDLSDTTQANITELIGGKRNANIISALLENFSVAEKAVESSSNAAGSALAENEKYLDSIAGKISVFQASLQTLSTDLISSDLVKRVLELGTGLVNVIDSMVKLQTLLPAILTSLVGFYVVKKSFDYKQSAANVDILVGTMTREKSITDSLSVAITNLNWKEKELLKTKLADLAASGQLDAKLIKQIETILGVSLAEGALTTANKTLANSFKSVQSSIPVWGWISLVITVVLDAILATTSAVDAFGETTADKLDSVNQKLEQTISEAQQTASEFRDLEKSSKEDIFPRFIELAKGVDKFGNQMRLTDEEYKEFLSLNNKIAEMFPDINNGFDANGNAMLDLSYNADTLAASLENLIELERQSTLQSIAGNMDETITYINNKINSVNDSVDEVTDDMRKWRNAGEEVKTLMQLYQDGRWATLETRMMLEYPISTQEFRELMGSVLGISPYNQGFIEATEGLDNFDFKNNPDWADDVDAYVEEQIFKLNEKIPTIERSLEGVWDSLNPVVTAWIQLDFKYNELEPKLQEIAQLMTAHLDFSELGISTEKEVQDYITQYIITPLYNIPNDARDALTQAFDKLQSGNITSDEFRATVSSTFSQMFSGMSEDDANAFKDIFVSSLSEAGFTGRNFDEVLRSLVADWIKLSDAVNDSSYGIVSYTEGMDAAYETLKAMNEAVDKAANKYNSIVNGNVDYAQRPLISPDDMRKVYPEFEGEIATTYSSYYTIGEGEALYTIDITPILEDGTVLSEQALSDYVRGLVTDNGIDGVLASDSENLIINIVPGDYDEEYWNSYQAVLSSVKNEHWEFVKQQRKALNVIGTGTLETKLSEGLSLLDKVYEDVVDKGSFDYSSIIDNEDFYKAFGNLKEEYVNFISTLVNSPNDITACQEAFNRLTTEFIKQSGALNNLTASSRESAIAYLKQNGIANASILVDKQIAYNTEKARLATEGWTEKTWQQIEAERAEQVAGTLTYQALAELALQKRLLDENKIDSVDEVNALIDIAEAANVSSKYLNQLAEAEKLALKIETEREKINNIPDGTHGKSAHIAQAEEYIAMLQAQINNLVNNGVEFEPINIDDIVNYTGGTTTTNAKDKAETWFEKEYNRRKHLMEMDQQDTEDYLNWLESAYKKAYKEGIIELDDYYKYEEEVYQGRKELFEDHLNDIEHDISMREGVEGESGNIIKLYSGLIKDVEAELSKARARGLTDEDDYIQELQDKWQEYGDSIKDIREEALDGAKDALDELVDYKLDMIKQDIEDEKDALDKKLDYLKEFYDKQKEMLQDQYDEEKYLDDQAEKRKSVSDLRSELEQLKYDDSAWAQKRKIEIQEELTEAEKELTEFEDDHALELALDAIENSYDAQEKQLQAEMDALDERLNDPQALFNKALSEIQKNTSNLYSEMLEYNRKHGSGNDADVTDVYEEAYKALLEYKDVYGKDYEGVVITNATNYKPNTSAATVTGTVSSSTSTSSSSVSSGKTSTASSTPSLANGTSVQVKSTATRFGSKSQNAYMASFVPGGTFTVYGTSGDQVLIGRNGVYTGWVNKNDIVGFGTGYASGTRYATKGIHEIDEEGTETIFESSDGAKYKMFTGGEKVLNAKASDFLYKFATSGGDILSKMFEGTLGTRLFDRIRPVTNTNEIVMGDIVVQGNADKQTVSEIRRAQRDNLSDLLKGLNRLK